MWEITLVGEVQDYMHFLVFEKMLKTTYASNVFVGCCNNNHNTTVSIAVKNKKLISTIKSLIIELMIKICKEEYFIENLTINTKDKDLQYFILLTAVMANLEDEIDYARVKFKFYKVIHIRSFIRFRLAKLYYLWERFSNYFNLHFSGTINDELYLEFLRFLTSNSRNSGDIIYLDEKQDDMCLLDKNQKVLVSIPKTDEIGIVVNLIVYSPSKLIINCYSSLSGKIAELIKYLFDDRMSILI